MIQQSHSWEYTQRKIIIQKDSCSVFIVALFIIAGTWKEPKCCYPPTEEWKKQNVVYVYIYVCIYIHTMEYYSVTKMNGTVHFAEIWVDLETVI